MNGSTVNRFASAAVGTSAILLGLRQVGRTRVLSVAAGTGLLAYGALAKPPHRQPVSLEPLAITRVITVGKPRDELFRMWRDPQVMSDLFGDVLQVSREGEGRIRLHMSLPGRREITWTSRLVEQGQGSSLLWRTDPGAAVPHEMFIRFRDAHPAEWGTEVTLGISPLSNDRVTKALVRLTDSVDEAMLTKVLRRFKSLVETGEMPTLSHNPAGRHRAIAAA
ncbi:hypothetical protein JAO29_20420 [Edaphobacter sp. HDX4]|uniref:SRPBCC family protein n=1 Tax=Edaphobacter sp. HDX4 TaxID=2794064 RepID=UPI002FE6319A